MGNGPSLHQAVLGGKLEEVRALLNRGENVNVLDGHGNNALLALLLRSTSRNALVLAENEFHIVNTLLRGGISVNQQNHDGIACLHVACLMRDLELMSALLKNGASPCIRTKFGLSAMDVLTGRDGAVVPPEGRAGESAGTMKEVGVVEEGSLTFFDPLGESDDTHGGPGENAQNAERGLYDRQVSAVERIYLLQNTSLYSVEGPREVCRGESITFRVTAEDHHDARDTLYICKVKSPPWDLELTGISNPAPEGEFGTVSLATDSLEVGQRFRVVYYAKLSGKYIAVSSPFVCRPPLQPQGDRRGGEVISLQGRLTQGSEDEDTPFLECIPELPGHTSFENGEGEADEFVFAEDAPESPVTAMDSLTLVMDDADDADALGMQRKGSSSGSLDSIELY